MADILLVGNCVLDQIWELAQYPTEDQETRVLSKDRMLGGNACNSAQVLHDLGNEVELVSSFANDSTAAWMLNELASKGISTRFSSLKNTGISAESSIWLNSQNGSRTIVHHRDLAELSLRDLQKIPLQRFQWIHFEGRNIHNLQKFLVLQKNIRHITSLEIEKPRGGIEQLITSVNTVIVSRAYLQHRQISASQCIREFSLLNPSANIVCTLGESGVLAQSDQGKRISLPAEKVSKVIDTTGAGDCFIAGLIHRLTNQDDFESALVFANELAARKIQIKGLKIKNE